MSILDKILSKKGLKSAEQLNPEEKETFEQWRLVLNKEQLSIEDIKVFCQSQIDVIEAKWIDLNTPQDKKAELIPYHTVYNLILKAIDAPKAAKEALEKNLTQLLN